MWLLCKTLIYLSFWFHMKCKILAWEWCCVVKTQSHEAIKTSKVQNLWPCNNYFTSAPQTSLVTAGRPLGYLSWQALVPLHNISHLLWGEKKPVQLELLQNVGARSTNGHHKLQALERTHLTFHPKENSKRNFPENPQKWEMLPQTLLSIGNCQKDLTFKCSKALRTTGLSTFCTVEFWLENLR
jgi:hypothetical protein